MWQALLAIEVAIGHIGPGTQVGMVQLIADQSALYLVDSLLEDRIGYVDRVGRVRIMDWTGEVESELQLEAASRALYITDTGDVVVAKEGPRVIGATGQASSQARHIGTAFGQGGTIFYESNHGVLVQPSYRGLSTKSYFVSELDSAGGIGIDWRATSIAVMRNPSFLPTIEVIAFNSEHGWISTGPPVAPVMSSGMAVSTVISYNDVRPMTDSQVLFFGRPAGDEDLPADFTVPGKISPSERSRTATLYLFVHDLRLGTCRAFVKFRAALSTEVLRARVGRLSLSRSERFIFLLINDTIWKVPWKEHEPSHALTRDLAHNYLQERT